MTQKFEYKEKPRYRIDLHVHTRRYSRCAELLDPNTLGRQMRQRGLHGVVLTEHDIMWNRNDIMTLNAQFDGVKLFSGVEVSSRDGHFIVIGLDDMDGIEPGIPAAELIQKAADSGAAVILVHHHMAREYSGNPNHILTLPSGIDAIEVASSITVEKNQEEAARYSAIRGWHPVAGSDAHSISIVGETYTAFSKMTRDEKSLAQAIKKVWACPCDRRKSTGENNPCCWILR